MKLMFETVKMLRVSDGIFFIFYNGATHELQFVGNGDNGYIVLESGFQCESDAILFAQGYIAGKGWK